MTKTITLSNDFHNTEARVRPVAIIDGPRAGKHLITRATALRLRRTLCGSPECVCGDTFGARGGVNLRGAIIGETYEPRGYVLDLRYAGGLDTTERIIIVGTLGAAECVVSERRTQRTRHAMRRTVEG